MKDHQSGSRRNLHQAGPQPLGSNEALHCRVYVIELDAAVTRDPAFIAKNATEQATAREQFAGSAAKLVSIEEARAKAATLDFSNLPKPAFVGVRVMDGFSLAELREFIDWTPFFHTWELRGVYPKILEHEKYGEQARKIFADANAMLDRFISENTLTARAVYGFFPANRVGDDLVVWTDETRTVERTRLHHLRQQVAKDNADPYRCLADFVAEKGGDHIAAFGG